MRTSGTGERSLDRRHQTGIDADGGYVGDVGVIGLEVVDASDHLGDALVGILPLAWLGRYSCRVA